MIIYFFFLRTGFMLYLYWLSVYLILLLLLLLLLLLIFSMFPRVCSSIKYLSCNWSKCITWSNISQLKMGNIRWYSQIFKFSFTTIKVFVQNLIQDERVVCFCHRRKDIFVCSWIRTINSKRTSEHPTLAWRLITQHRPFCKKIFTYICPWTLSVP